MRGAVADRSGTQEQAGLEERVSEDVEHGRQPRAGTEAQHHVPELAHRAVGKHPLDVGLHESERGGNHDGDRRDDHDHVRRRTENVQAGEEHWIQPGDEEHAGDHHGRGVQERADRSRAGHRVGQPSVQRKLAALSDASYEERDCRHQDNRRVRVARERPCRHAPNGEAGKTEIGRRPLIGGEEQDGDADEQTHVAGTHGEERLQRRAAVRAVFPPVTDEHERAETHDLPAQEEEDHVFCDDHRHHSGREQRQGREKVGVSTIAAQILERVHLHERGDEGDDEEHHHGETVDVLSDGELCPAGLPPRPGSNDRGNELLFGRRVDALNPLPRRSARQHEAGDERQHTDFAALLRQALSEQHDERETDRRHHGREPRIVEEPAARQRRERLGCSQRRHPLISLSSSRPMLRLLR